MNDDFNSSNGNASSPNDYQSNQYEQQNNGYQSNQYDQQNNGYQSNPYGQQNNGYQPNQYGQQNSGYQPNQYGQQNNGYQPNQYGQQNNGYQSNPYGQQPNYYNNANPYSYQNNNIQVTEDPGNTLAIISLIMGIIAICLSFCFGFGGLIGIVSIVLSVVSGNKSKSAGLPRSGMAIAGLICGIVAVVLGAFCMVYCVGILADPDLYSSGSYSYYDYY